MPNKLCQVPLKLAQILGGIDANCFELGGLMAAFFCLAIKGEGSLVIVIYN
jgi:hypothetical protein